jgi:ligand-binding sensor domain-containing protein
MTTCKSHQMLQYLLFLSVFILSCNGLEKPKLSKGNQPDSKPVSNEQNVKSNATAQISEYVVEIFEDTKDNLWFGTVSDGAVRYDGKTLTYFSTKDGLCDNTVAGIAEDKDGNMWFGTHNGISKYDGKTFTTFAETKGHISGCKILIDSKGQIWVGTTEGAFRYNGSSFSEFKIPKPTIKNLSHKVAAGKVWRILEDKKGNIWFGRDGFGACKFDGSSFTHFTQKDGLCSNNVSEIVEDNQGHIWFGCLSSDFPIYVNDGGVSRYDGKTFTQYPEIEGLSKNDIYTLYEDKTGNIWIGALHLGAYRYNEGKFTLFKEIDKTDNMTAIFGIQSILEDRKGRLWFGFSGGLFRFNGTSFTNVTKAGSWK